MISRMGMKVSGLGGGFITKLLLKFEATEHELVFDRTFDEGNRRNIVFASAFDCLFVSEGVCNFASLAKVSESASQRVICDK